MIYAEDDTGSLSNRKLNEWTLGKIIKSIFSLISKFRY